MPAYQNTSSGYKVSTTAGVRQGLFAPSIVVQTSGLDAVTAEVERKLAKAMLEVAVQAREMARKMAPKATGALAAGIYVTGLVSKSELDMARDGDEPFTHKMLGHTRGFYSALTAAARRSERDIPAAPGSADQTHMSKIVFARTQRLKGRMSGKSLTGEFGREFQGSKKRTGIDYAMVNQALPFNEFGAVGRENMYIGLGSIMYYSAWVEFGTSRMRARPFFTPAANWMQTQALARMARELQSMKVDVTSVTGGGGKKYLRPQYQTN